MKLCPYCAEEIQDAAIKCRYCGSMLIEPIAPAVQRLDALLNEDAKRVHDEGNEITKERALGLAVAQVDVVAVEMRDDPLRAVAAISLPAPRSEGKLLAIALGISFVVLLGAAVLGVVMSQLGERANNDGSVAARQGSPSTTASAPAASPGRQRTAATESSRAAFNEMVKRGLIKRTDIESGKFYIYGDLWEGFELDAKENIVRIISEHRDAEFGLPQVTLLESRSGKELGSFGAFSGVTIK